MGTAQVLVTLRIEFFQRSVERPESARPQVLQVILSAFWRIVDKKGTLGNAGPGSGLKLLHCTLPLSKRLSTAILAGV